MAKWKPKKKCGKIWYRTKLDAVLHMSKMKNEHTQSTHLPKRAYDCHKCDGWHVTSKPDRFDKTREGC